MLVHQAFRFELDPSNTVASALASSAGAARFAHNWGLALVKARLDERARVAELLGAEGLSGREASALAGSSVEVPWSLPALRREWNRAKDVVAPWWAVNSKECYSSGLDALARGLKAYSDSRNGRRRGPKVGFPKFKKRGAQRAWRITTGSFGIVDDRHVRLPRIGVVRSKEPTTALSRRLDAGAARILSATVKQAAGRWSVSFTCEAERPELSSRKAAAVVGVDVGVRCLAVCSAPVAGVSDEDGQVPNPKHLSRYHRRIARLQAELSRRNGPARGRRPSKRWCQTKARLGRCHAKVASARADSLHKLTTALAKGHEIVVIEDLGVAGMTASAKGSGHWRGKAGLNRVILDAAPAQLRRQLEYKTRWYSSRLHTASRWYPSSKTCSACKTVKTKLSLAERTYRCERCGLVIDRDRNAAANLAWLVEAVVTGTASGAGTGQETILANGRGEERLQAGPAGRCSSQNRQDGTGPQGPDRTVTATRQRAAPKPVLVGSDR